MTRSRPWHMLLGLFVAALVWPHSFDGQSAAPPPGEWRNYGNDEKSTRYSPLDQITRDTIKNMQVAWTWKSDIFGTSSESIATETTPIMVNGVLYFTMDQRRTVIAANAGTGETLWTYRPEEGERFTGAAQNAPRRLLLGRRAATGGSSS